MVTQVDWNDGTGEKIYFSYGSSEGTQTISVSSDVHTGYIERSKTVTFRTTSGTPTVTATLTVKQSGRNITLITYNDTAMTSNDVAVGYE